MVKEYTGLAELNLTILKDDKDYFPPYYAVPVVHNNAMEKFPQLKDSLNKMEDILTDQEMQQLNYRVDVKKEDMDTVAKTYLQEKGLISS